MLVFRERVERLEPGTLREKPLGGEKRINKLNPYANSTHESKRALTVELGLASDGDFLQKELSRISLHSVLVPVQPRQHTA